MKKQMYILLLSILFQSCISIVPEPKKSLFLVQSSRNNSFYYTDEYDMIQISNRFQGARQFSNHLAAVKIDEKWGFINEEGSLVIPNQFNWVSSFGEFGFDKNVAIVKMNINKDRNPMFTPSPTFLINTVGDTISYTYGFIYPIEKKLAIVNNGTKFENIGHSLSYSSDGGWGCINRNGKEIVKCKYELMYPFRDDITFVRKNGKWGCINDNGKEIIPCKFDGCYFQNNSFIVDTFVDTGFLKCTIDIDKFVFKDSTIYAFIGNKYYCFDKKGNKLN